jgi:hypothetical protein
MASLARALGRVMRRNFKMNAAWLPLTTPFRLGDYGLWRGGVFQPLGNVADDFGVTIDVEDGEPVSLDFESKGVVVVDEDASASGSTKGANVVDGEVGLVIRASQSQSFVIKAPTLTSQRMTNVARVAAQIDRLRDEDKGPPWSWRYKIVTEIFTGDNVTILATIESNTTIRLSGKADTAREILNAAIKADVSADKSLGLSFLGATGPVGLRLARVKNSGRVAVSFGQGFDGEGDDDGEAIADDLVVEESDWDSDPEDDPDDAFAAGAAT